MTYPTIQDKLSYVLTNGYTKKSLADKMGYKLSTPITRVENGGKPFQGFEEKLDRIICEIEVSRRGEIKKRFVGLENKDFGGTYTSMVDEDEEDTMAVIADTIEYLESWHFKMIIGITLAVLLAPVVLFVYLAITGQWLYLVVGLAVSVLSLAIVSLIIIDESTK